MAGRYYRIKRLRRRSVNRFTADTYDAVCSDIYLANIAGNKKKVIVKHAKNKMGSVAELIKDVLKYNSVSVLSYSKYASTNVKTEFLFNSKEDAQKAQGIINKMALPDTVNRQKVNTDGSTVTNNGVKIKVDVDINANGNPVLREGTNYIPSGNTTQQTQTEKSSSGDLKKWIIIGGAALLVVVVVLVIMKKKKIIK